MNNVINLHSAVSASALSNKDSLEAECLKSLEASLRVFMDEARVSKHGEPSSATYRAMGVSLYSMIRHWIVVDFPKLIEAVEPGRIQLYGGFTVETDKGRLKFTSNDGKEIYSYENEKAFVVSSRLIDAAEARFVHECIGRIKSQLSLDVQAGNRLADIGTWVRDEFKLKIWGLHSRQVLVKTLDKRLWDAGIYDKELFGCLVRMMARKNLTVGNYNRFVIDKPVLMKRISEAPSMAPMLTRVCAHKIHKDDYFKIVRESFIAEGGTPAAWRWLTKQSSVVVEILASDSWYFAECINAFAISGVKKLSSNAKIYFNLLREPRISDRLVDAIIVASKARASRKLLNRDLEHSWPLVVDYIRANKDVSIKKKSWSTLVRLQDRWHRDEFQARLAIEMKSGRMYRWHPVVQEVVASKFKAVSLNNTAELMVEGFNMQHCVGGYSMQCYRNSSRIYSVMSSTGERLATLEASFVNGKWQVNQIYGFENSRVEPAVVNFGKRVISAMNRALMPTEENTFEQLSDEDTSELLKSYGLAA